VLRGGCPILPVWRGEMQCRLLGMAWKSSTTRRHAVRGVKGELVCTKPFPTMPLGFWNDPGGKRYRAPIRALSRRLDATATSARSRRTAGS
jgi:acyl-coenzyme A synthetase/AMP-(fatty) acid ligase